MKKFFLIPLFSVLCTVMVWGTEVVVDDFATLKTQLSASGTADVVKLGQDITYEGTAVLDIQRSLTLDGQGHKLIGFKKTALKTDGTSEQHWTSIAINAGQFGSTAELDVTIKNLSLGNTTESARYYGILAFDGVKKLTLENDSVVCGNYSAQQPLCFTGTSATPIDLTIKDSYIFAGTSAYPAYILKPINATLKNSTFEGYCALYFKYRASSMYGVVVGSRGSVVNAEACAFNAPNIHSGTTNAFGIFPMEDDGITLNLNNCSFNAQQIGDQAQMVISMQGVTRPNGFQPVRVNISGDNTHVYNVNLLTFALTGWNWDDDEHLTTYKPAVDAPLELNISGGTFSINPEKIKFHTYKDNGASFDIDSARIATGYEVQEVKQGTTTLYRVVKKVEKGGSGDPLYDLNDAVETAAEGANPVTSFELSAGGTMELDEEREVTTAGYVQVKDNEDSGNATVVKVGTTATADPEQKVDQTLVINNGLDVQGKSQVIVEAGSTLKIGEGGITTEDPENIVIETDEKGAASLIMDPAITVNQTPKLTVRMTAKQIGRDGEGDFYWHRFALPVAADFTSWEKEGNLVAANPAYTVQYPTYLYGWNYATNDWDNITPGEMKPLQGYTLTLASDYIHVDGEGKVVSEGTAGGNLNVLQDVVYTFKGNLVGNTDNPLKFQHEGFNFFGNSYTGYMDVKTVLQGLESDKIDGTAYMWCNDPENVDLYQTYTGVSLYKLLSGKGLEKWQQEVAPMQTFILRLRGADSADEAISYAAAIWGNPRYNKTGSGSSPAPRRVVAAVSEETYLEIAVKAANGKASRVDFTETANNTDAFESGYDVEKYMNEKSINLYATVNGMNLSSVVTDNIAGKTLSLTTNGEIAYTISFKNVEGNEYALRDNATGAVVAIEDGATYDFAAQPNSTVEGRFEIVNRYEVTTALENTEVKANAKGIYSITGQYLGEDFQALPAGVYVVNGVKIVK